jgi:hypothetical protein
MPVPRPDAKLPPPSAELILIGTMAQAFLEELPRKRRAPFLRRVGELLELQREYPNVVRLRPPMDDAALADARDQAIEWWRRALQMMMTHL